ncbi:hypothetical protein WA026_023545 [Henosepilachna vigintioctopunctata]|uniref:PDZ domain-containing protein 8 n=1 Tax=Henosepilachna vigintioctopunctata TaxID=420089 RepID=A0AAW1UR12_9CUCU
MDIFGLFFLSCISILVGIIITLVVQYYLLYAYFKKSPLAKSHEKAETEDYSLPETLKKQIESESYGSNGKDCTIPVSLILQFLFHELRHSESIKCWLFKKLSLEFDELLTKTTIGKFFDSISIKDMHLGNQFPDIKEVNVEEVKLDKKGHIETVSLCLNIDYAGNFLLCIDGKMKFSKAAFLSIKVKKICGLVRLQFTRIPYTHWSFSFYSDPIVELAVESHFQGRQLQSNITNLIVNQIKKAIKRKHTLPNYKIRYKPFFVKTDPSQLDLEDGEIVPQGHLEVNCTEISRLSIPAPIQNIYATFTVDNIPWICVYQKDDIFYMTVEVILTKLRQSPLGVVFKQEQGQVIVDNVSPHSLAHRSGLRPGDIVLTVENKNIVSVPQVAKAIKSISGSNITIKIERVAENYVMKSIDQNIDKTDGKIPNGEMSEEEILQTEHDSFVIVEGVPKRDVTDKKTKILGVEKSKSSDKLLKPGSGSENVSKFAQTIGNFSLRKRKASVSERPSNENSAKTTPASSNPGTPQHTSFKQAISLPVLSAKKNSISELPEITKSDVDQQETSSSTVEIFKSSTVASNALLSLNNDYQFNLKDNSKYLNVNVWGSCAEGGDLLLGYANIPLSHILNECCNSVLGHYMRRYSFLPPTNVPPNSQTHPLLSHSGFEHVFCYGDILLSFIWMHEEDVEVKRKASIVSIELQEPSELMATIKHDFLRRQFHRTTQCDFCSKKIWLKDAVQCKNCGMCCHKKCISKCQLASDCRPSESTGSSTTVNPEITMTEADDLSVTDTEGKATNTTSTTPSGSIKRVNSVSNLSLPGSQFSTSLSRSLPPSPQRTPSRKQSLAAINPFLMCPAVLEEIQKHPEESIEAINRLLEQVLLCPTDERLMDAAKESGQQLYNHLTYSERTEKINVMVGKNQKRCMKMNFPNYSSGFITSLHTFV